MKKFVSFFLSLLLVISLIAVVAHAEDDIMSYSDIDAEMQLLYKLEIIPKIYSDKELGDFVNRSDVAIVAANSMNVKEMISGMGDDVTFADVNPLSEGADSIAFLNNQGIMTGSNGMFYPENPILVQEALKVMTSLAGYEAYAQVKGGYPNGYFAAAQKMGLYSALSKTMEEQMTRRDLLKLVYATLLADAAEGVSFSKENVDYAINRSVISLYFDAYEIEGIVTANTMGYLFENADIVDERFMIDSTEIDPNGVDIDGYIGLPVRAYVTDDGSVDKPLLLTIQVNEKRGDIIEIAHTDLNSLTSDGVCSYYEDNKSKFVNISNTANVIYNNRFASKLYECKEEWLTITNGNVKLIDADSNNVYETVIITEAKLVLLEGGNELSELLVGVNGEIFSVSEDVYDRVVIMNDGMEIRPGSVKRHTVAELYESADKKYLYVVMTYKSVSGKVTLIDEDNEQIAVDDVLYQASAELISNLSVGQTGQFYFDSKERLVAVNTKNADGKHYAIVVACGYDGSALKKDYKIKLFDDTGNMKTLSLKDSCTIDGKKRDIDDSLDTQFKSGESAIIRTMIRYSVNSDNEIDWLDTLQQDEVPSEDELIADYTNMKMIWKKKTSIFGDSLVKVTSDTPIFSVPAEGYDEDNRWSLRKLSGFTNDRNYTIYAYSLDEMRVPGAMAIYESVSTTGTPSYDISWFIYKGTGYALDEYGNYNEVLKGWKNGGEQTVKLPDYYTWTGASFGDIYQLSTNSFMEVTGTRLCHTADDEVYMRDSSVYGVSVGSGFTQTFGRILRVDGSNVVVNVGTDDAPDERVYDVSIATNAYIIDREEETISSATTADLSPNSLIIIRDRNREPQEYAIIR